MFRAGGFPRHTTMMLPLVPSAAGYTTAQRYELWLLAATYLPAGARTGDVVEKHDQKGQLDYSRD
jgi:hypothetical protein